MVAEGEFDGVHCGHQRVLGRVVEWARDTDGEAVVLLHRVRGEALRLSDLRTQLERLAAAGIELVVMVRPTAAAAALERMRPVAYAGARAPSRELPGMQVAAIQPVTVGGVPITSAGVRASIAAADLAGARAMLGRFPAVAGRVVHGFHRGAPLGIPTANIRVRGVQLPPDGVYAVRAAIGGAVAAEICGVANIGFNPTFGNRVRSVETHLFDFAGDLYGQRLRIELVARLRGEQRFAGIDALLAQIRSDIATARKLLGG